MIKKMFSSELAKGSIYLSIMLLIFNFFNFIFQFLMASMLGPEDYGVFAVLISIFYFMAIPMSSIEMLMSKYTSKFKVKKEHGKIKYLLSKIFSKGIKLSAVLFILLIPLMFAFSYFLKIDFFLLILTSSLIFFIFTLPAIRGVMLGMKQFVALGGNFIIEGLLKLLAATFLIFIGLRVYGAIIGIIFGTIAAMIFSFIPIRKIIQSKKERAENLYLFSQSSKIFFAFVAILLFQSIDIILAKRFFSPEMAGQYAVANLLGKIIFFGTFAVTKVMFPIASENHEFGNKTGSIFMKSLSIVAVLSTLVVLVYALFPEIIITLLFGAEYLVISEIVVYMGVAFTLISFSAITLMYAISINKGLKIWHLLVFFFSQILILTLLNNSLFSFSIGMVFSGAIIFIFSLLIVMKKNVNQS
ncbi:MAG: oligosaccharide flippase family protein [Candidatus Pacearchaeota archaeon]